MRLTANFILILHAKIQAIMLKLYRIVSWIREWDKQLNPKRAGLFGPISQPGPIPPPKISETDWRNIKCVVLVDSYDPPESIGTNKSTNIPCMTPQWRHKWRHVKNTKITKNCQNHGFSLFFRYFFKQSCIFLAMMCVKVCLHMFLLQINQINKIKHSESVSWKQKTRFVCNFHWKSVFGQFFRRWTQRSITQRRVITLGLIFLKMILNWA